MNTSKTIYAGIGAGLATILLFYGLYRYDSEVMLSMTTYWSSMVFYVIGIAAAMLRIKSIQAGVLPFRQALQVGFFTFLIANAIFFLFYFWLFTKDQSLIAIQYEQMNDFAKTLPKDSWGREQMAQTKLEDLKITFGDTVFRYARGAIGGFFISAALAALIKQEK